MSAMRVAIAAGVLSLLRAVPAISDEPKDWVDIKSANELQALYSNKTFKGKDWKDRPWVGHYRPDGQGVMLFEGGRYPRTWAIKGNDQVCATTTLRTTCYRFQRHKTKPGVYRNINVDNDMINEFVVEDGVPKF